MSERTSTDHAEPQRDLVAGLRQVDAAFATVKPGRDDVMDRLLAGDTDELVAQSERRLAARRRQRTVVGAVSAALVLVVVALSAESPSPSPSPAAVATSSPPASLSPVLPSSPVSAPVLPSSLPVSSPVLSPSSPSPSSVATLRRIRPLAPGQAGVVVAVDGAALAPIALPSSPGLVPVAPTGVDGAIVGVASPLPVPGDDDVEAALREARALSTRGDFGAAADVLGALLAQQPSARVVDAVAVQRATLLGRAGRRDEACVALQAHRERFPASDNAVVVATALDRLSCR